MTFVECRPTIEKFIHKSSLVKMSYSFTSLEFVSPGMGLIVFKYWMQIETCTAGSFQLWHWAPSSSTAAVKILWTVCNQSEISFCNWEPRDTGTWSSSQLVPGQLRNVGSSGIFQRQGEGTGKAPGCLYSGLLELTGATQHRGAVVLCITSGWANAPLSWFSYKEVLGNSNFRYPKNLKHNSKNQTEITKEVFIAGIGIHKHSQTGLRYTYTKEINQSSSKLSTWQQYKIFW